ELTVAAYNLERFFDTVDDPAIGEPVLTTAAYDKRLAKASLGIRNYLQTPDILGIIEIENLATLQDLADQINADAGAASPQYEAYLVEGNDVGGIDVGFLVKTAEVAVGVERVQVVEVQQELDGSLLVNPDATTSTLNDRPPLRLEAIVHHPNGGSYPVTVIVNHMRSLNGSADEAAGSNGWPTAGARVRAKRQEQAEDLANLVQSLQTADPAQPIVLIGDFNAFEFNDGLGDSMGTIEGTPSPDAETAVPGDGADLVDPDLDNLADTAPAAERYSFLFDGNAQSLDHVLVNQALIASTSARRVEHPRINADFPEIDRNVAGTTRLADHDPIVAYFAVAEFATAGVSISKSDMTDPAVAGTTLGYTVLVSNGGPDDATAVEMVDTLPAGTTFVSLTAPAGWSCTTPAVGTSGTVTCTTPLLANTGMVASFDLTVAIDPAVAPGTITNTATVTTDTADDPADNTTTVTTQVNASADYSLTLADFPDPVVPGTVFSYFPVATNAGPSVVPNAQLVLTLPAGVTFEFLDTIAAAGWSCSTPAVGQPVTSVTCTIAAFPVGTATFRVDVRVGAATPGGTVLTASGTLTAGIPDSSPGDTTATTTTTVVSSASLTATKTATGPFTSGATFTYTIVVTNGGPGTQGDNPGNEVTDSLPAGLTLVSASASSGTVVADTVNHRVTWNVSIAAGASVTITIQAAIPAATAPGTPFFNQATLRFDADGDGTNEAAGLTDDPVETGADDPTGIVVQPAVNIAEIPTLDQIGLMALATILAMLGAWRLRRRPAR
ncbi:MAG TPA: IPTL-CTERM sorting domain-containing protein, partial [Thermoanaerobaculia bacterium]|nr:IPTL-CTERM sorting domain-containing protein [Thermoanaerobaculia bacterium]